MNKEEMKQRTKRFALNIIQLVGALPKDKLLMYSGDNCYGQAPRLDLITELPVEPNRLQILLPRWVWLKKKLMRQYIGWNFLLKAVLCKVIRWEPL